MSELAPSPDFATQVLGEEGTTEQLAHRIVHEYGPRWWNAYHQRYPNSAVSDGSKREAMAHYCVAAVIEATKSAVGGATSKTDGPHPPDATPGAAPPTESTPSVADEFLLKYPVHARLESIRPLSQAIYDFLEWCEERSIVLAEQEQTASSTKIERWWPILKSRRDLLAEHFEIDQQVLETEKRRMLETFTASQQLPGGIHEASCQQGEPCADPAACPDPVGCDHRE